MGQKSQLAGDSCLQIPSETEPLAPVPKKRLSSHRSRSFKKVRNLEDLPDTIDEKRTSSEGQLLKPPKKSKKASTVVAPPKILMPDPDKYRVSNSLEKLDDIGELHVTLVGARGLVGADFNGKSDPYAVLTLGEVEKRTPTVYKTLNPEWNGEFVFPVLDISDILYIKIYDEDRFNSPEFLGMLAVPLLRLRDEDKMLHTFALKNKRLEKRAKGVHPQIMLKFNLVWNPLRGAIKCISRKEEKEEENFKKRLFVHNVQRVKKILDFSKAVGDFMEKCFKWEDSERSAKVLIFYEIFVFFFQPHFIPVSVLLFIFIYPFYANEILIFDWANPYETDESDDDDEEEEKSDKKSLMENLKAISQISKSVQNGLGDMASMFEQFKNLLNFSVPYMSWLFVGFLCVASVVLYCVSLRWLLMIYGIHKFTKRLLRPNHIPSSEIKNFLSRVPDDPTLQKCKKLPIYDPRILTEEEEKAAGKLEKDLGGLVGAPIKKRFSALFQKDSKGSVEKGLNRAGTQ